MAQTNPASAYLDTIPGTSLAFKMVPIPAGNFLLGSPETQVNRKPDEGPQKNIQISGFWMEEHEVTYDEFFVYFNDDLTSVNSEIDAVTRPTSQYIDLSWGMGKTGGFPMNSMSQRTALMYCYWLYKKTGRFYRLPTEAEWEYACKAGSTNTYSFGDDTKLLKDYAWFQKNSNEAYHKVMEKKPNAWGLYDMHGNLSEWTLDQYDANWYQTLQDGAQDPIKVATTKYPRSVRGGNYLAAAPDLRSAARVGSQPSWNRRDPQIPKSKWWLTEGMGIGFRIVRPFIQPSDTFIENYFKLHLGTEPAPPSY